MFNLYIENNNGILIENRCPRRSDSSKIYFCTKHNGCLQQRCSHSNHNYEHRTGNHRMKSEHVERLCIFCTIFRNILDYHIFLFRHPFANLNFVSERASVISQQKIYHSWLRDFSEQFFDEFFATFLILYSASCCIEYKVRRL